MPAWIDELIKKLYASDPQQRYASVEDFLRELRQCLLPSSQQEVTAIPEEEDAQQESVSVTNRTFRPGERIGDYRVVRFIKSGGFAQVYLVTHLLQDREYALKVNNHSVPLSSLIDEFRFLNELYHRNIVKVHWSGQLPDGRYYLTMEYLAGESLAPYAWEKNVCRLHRFFKWDRMY